MPLDPETYREEAQAFVTELDREYHLHYSGQKADFEVEEVYRRHSGLFERGAVEELRELAQTLDGEEGRRARYLLELGVGGFIGRATAGEEQELAQREASLALEVRGEEVPYRAAPVLQANEEDGDVRADIERQRHALLDEHLNPLHRTALERAHSLVGELGWASYAEACADLRGIDLEALAGQTRQFLEATADVYPGALEPELREVLGIGIDEVRRSDLARLFRAPALDGAFEDDRLIPSFTETMAGMGLDLEKQPNIVLDTEQRPTKTPRAYCAPVRVPEEVYLVVPRVGGREDFAALFHEGGHAQHFGNTRADMPFEFRHLGDNSVTESFAFLLEHIAEDPLWLREVAGAEPQPIVRHVRAVRLFYLRRYAAKLNYELALHGAEPELEAMPQRYADELGSATRVPWTPVTWLEDVDEGFYVAAYLRAWALESRWRAHLIERFGEGWFREPAAGEWLRGIWSHGQRLDAAELLGEVLGEDLRFDTLAADFAAA